MCGILLSLYSDCSQKKATFSKIRVAYNNVYRKLLRLYSRSNTSEICVINNNTNFETIIRKYTSLLKYTYIMYTVL